MLIDALAFCWCEKLTSIKIPDSVTDFGFAAFSSTAWLKNKTAKTPLFILNNVLVDGEKATGKVVIPDTITKICDGAFYENKKMTSVVVPEGITEIPESCFKSCSALKSVTLPKSLQTVHEFAFAYCTKLKNITLPEKTNYIDNYAFYGCDSLEWVAFLNYSDVYFNGGKYDRIFNESNKPALYYHNLKVYMYAYSMDMEHEFISSIDYSDTTITLDKTSYSYDGTAKRPNITVIYDGDKLVSGKDFTVTYYNNKKVGTAKAVITGIGKYTGTVEKTFEIKK